MKRVVFLIVGLLMVLGLVLPGCGGGTTPPPTGPVTYNFTSDNIRIGIVGPMTYIQGQDMWDGANLAKNDVGVITLQGHTMHIVLDKIDAKEIAPPYSDYPKQQVENGIAAGDNFFTGGFRTEAVVGEVEAAMAGDKMFFICGAATDDLVLNVYHNYAKYQYLFRAQPLSSTALFMDTICQLHYAADVIMAALNTTNTQKVKVAFLAEALDWTVIPRGVVQTYLAELNYTYAGTVTCTDTATDVNSQLDNIRLGTGTINGTGTNVIFTFLSGPVGISYGQDMGSTAHGVAALTVGINVEAQAPGYWNSVGTGDSGHNGAEGQIGLVTYGPGINITAKTGPFLALWAAANLTYGSLPIYTSSTYDVVHGFVTALQSLDAAGKTGIDPSGNVYINATDLIAWYENPANIQVTTGGSAAFYPNSAGIRTLVGLGVPCYPHDLVFGPQTKSTGLGCEWLNVSGTGTLVGVWPTTSLFEDYAAQALIPFNAALSLNWIGYKPAGIQNITLPCWLLTAWNLTC